LLSAAAIDAGPQTLFYEYLKPVPPAANEQIKPATAIQHDGERIALGVQSRELLGR
jgi:hypothetical protein